MKEVKDIWQFFENMNEAVYASDVDTYEKEKNAMNYYRKH